MKRYGLLGQRLGHSYSPQLHALLADYSYDLWPTAPQDVPALMRGRDFDGMNVTIPYKQAVMPYLDELGDAARRVGCVNTVVRQPDGTLYGDNTDVYGFSMMAQRAGADFAGVKTLVLGSGGASLTACDAVRTAGGVPVVISRRGEDSYENIQKHADAAYVINATPVGMYPDTDASPLDLRRLPNLRGVLDMIYNPLRTRLLQQAQELGIPCQNGLVMLVYQAVRACELFTGKPVSPDRARAAEAALRAQAMNLVLVGMPGCGKSAIGRLMHARLGLPLVDIDAEIVREAGTDIEAIFRAEGESGFRARESALISRCAAQGGRILVTGGGAVKSPLNCQRLRQNGLVIHLTRELGRLATRGRPLSQGADALGALWRERAPLYAACADAEVSNNTTREDCAKRVEECYREAICDKRPQP